MEWITNRNWQQFRGNWNCHQGSGFDRWDCRFTAALARVQVILGWFLQWGRANIIWTCRKFSSLRRKVARFTPIPRKMSYEVRLKLYELESILPRYFSRVSKSTIANIRQVYSVDKSFSGTGTISFYQTHKEVHVSRTLPIPPKRKSKKHEVIRWKRKHLVLCCSFWRL